MQKSVLKILSIQTPLKFQWILGIFEQNQLSKKDTPKRFKLTQNPCVQFSIMWRSNFARKDFWFRAFLWPWLFFDKILNFFRISDYNQIARTFLPISWLSMSFFQREIVLTCYKSNFGQYRSLFGKGLPFLCQKFEKMQKIRPKLSSP